MVQIQPYPLWLGNAGDGRCLRALYDAEIEAVVQLAPEEAVPTVGREFVLCRFPLIDGGENPPALLRLAVQTVATLIRDGTRTLVCCQAGMSRSPAVAAAALAVATRQPFPHTLALIAGARPCDVHPGLYRHLSALLADWLT
jgi:protein-tyrosine phosphatase